MGDQLDLYQQEKTEDYNKFMQDMSERIRSLLLKVKGIKEVYDADLGKTKQVRVSPPLLNDEGMNYVESKFDSYLNPNLYMAFLDRPEALRCYNTETISFSMDMLENQAKYEATASNLKKVISLYCPVIYFGIIKSCSDKSFIQNTTKQAYQTRSNDMMQPQMPV